MKRHDIILLEKVLRESIKKKNNSEKKDQFEKELYESMDRIILEELEHIDSSLLESWVPEYDRNTKLNNSQIQKLLSTKIKPVLETMNLSEFSGNNPQFVSGLILEIAYTLDLAKKKKFNKIKKLIEQTYQFYGKEIDQDILSKKEDILKIHLANIFEDWGVDESEYLNIISEAETYLNKFGIKNLLWDPYEIYAMHNMMSNTKLERINEQSEFLRRLKEIEPKIYELHKEMNEFSKKASEFHEQIENASNLYEKKKWIDQYNDFITKTRFNIEDKITATPQNQPEILEVLRSFHNMTSYANEEVANAYRSIEIPPAQANNETQPAQPQQPEAAQNIGDYLSKKYDEAVQFLNPHYERMRESIMSFIKGIKGEAGANAEGAEAIGQQIRDKLYSKEGAIILGTTLLGLIALYIWRKKRGLCYGLTGSRKIECQKRAIDSVLVGLRSQYKNCPLSSNPERCKRSINKLIREWESKKRML